MRRENTQISKIRNAKGEMTKKMEIVTDYFENLYSNKFENIEQIDRFLDTYDHPKLKRTLITQIDPKHKMKLKQQ
jgi:hypothetical protein